MEMENNSRPRSIDRSRELKKPRLAPEDVVVAADRPPNGVRPRIPSASAAAVSRGVNHQQNQPHPQQNHQELVSQYKTALAELTFNSKPIITNLTIIAGENLPVAKWIAATICSNILEVPSDQKLPSLYLLDSIVKNIGRDYIKYFASRLPEVFCKAYRQVDSSIHSGMRHLFGTWKSVFPPACLQMIEKELGIVPASNGSSSGAATSRSESQSQRPLHSIHVNPKYLEARQRLQQSNKAKGSNASTATVIPPVDDAERPERTAAIGSERSWADLSMKHDFKNPQRETSSEPVLEKTTVSYDDYEYNSDHSRNSDLGYGRASERVTERDKRDKPWYGAEKNTAEIVVGQRNAFDSQHELPNYRASRPTLSSLQPTSSTQKSAGSGRGMSKSWKTSEEEEYMWDDMNSRLTDRRVDSSRKDVWTHDDTEKLELGDHLSQPRGEFDVGSRDHRESSTDSLSIPRRGTAFEHLTPSMWPLRETPTRDGLKHLGMASRISGQPEGPPTSVSGSLSSINPSLPRTGLQALTGLSTGGTPNFGSLVNTLSSTGTLGQQRHQPLRPASPSRQSSMLHPHSPSSSAFHQNPDSHNLPDEDHLHMRASSQFGSKTSHYVPSLHRSHHTAQNSFPIIPQNPIQSGTLQNFQSQSSQSMQTSSSLMNFPQRRHQNPFSFQSLPELNSGHIQKPVPISSSVGTPPVKEHSGHATNSSADIPGQSSRSNLLASILNSGFLSNNSVSGGFSNLSHQESGALNHPPFPSGLPPTHLATSSTPGGAPALALDSVSHAGMLSLTSNPQRMSAMPPLPPGPPPPSTVVCTTSQTSNVASAVPNPISGLLSSLVAKGLISTPAKESSSLLASQVPSHLQNQSPGLINHSSKPVSSHPAPAAVPKPSSGNMPPVSKSATKSIAASSSPATRKEVKDLIGIQFKPEIIRKSHPSVVGALFEDRPYQCNICGYRLELEEKLDKHLEWHASNKLKTSSSGRVSRKWFMRSDDWVAGNVNSSSESTPISSVGGSAEAGEQLSLVPADESQCICLLCAEVFKDYYCQERDQWMFKDAVYLPIPGADDGSGEGPIVHVNCITPTSVADLGLARNAKQEQVNG